MNPVRDYPFLFFAIMLKSKPNKGQKLSLNSYGNKFVSDF